MHLEPKRNGAMEFSFGKRIQQVDWRKLASVDLERLARDMDLKTLQDNIMHVTYCNLEAELGMQAVHFDPNFFKLFHLAQLIIEYLLHSQEYLSSSLETEMKKVQDAMQSAEQVRKELQEKSESQNKLKKEIKKLKKWIAEYQLMIRAGASGIHKCTYCAKAFVSQEYLIAHLSRRHDDHPPLTNGSIAMSIPAKPASVLVSSKPVNGEVPDNDKMALIEEMKQIKERLYATERELINEKSARELQNAKENNQFSNDDQKLKHIEAKYEEWKMREDQNHRRELESLKQTLQRQIEGMSLQQQEEKHSLTQAMSDLEMRIQTRPSMVGSIRDEDELDSPPKIRQNNEEVADLVRGEFQGQLQQMKLQTQEEMQREIRKQNEKWRGKLDRRQNEHNNEVQKVQDRLANYDDKLKGEQAEKERLARMVDNLTQKLNEHDKALTTKQVVSEKYQEAAPKQPVFAPPAAPRREVTFSEQDFANRERVKTPDFKDGPTDDAITLYVSANTPRNQYRLWRQKSDGSNEWIDKFNFVAYIKPLGTFTTPIYVYTASGSPYWRQYISSNPKPPGNEYRMEYMFYASKSAVPGAVELHVLDAGTMPVIRSCVTRSKTLAGWKNKGLSCYVMKSGSGMNASLSVSWDMDSTFTEGQEEESEESESELEEQPKPVEPPSESNVDVAVDESLESTADLKELTSGGSTSEWGTSTLQRGVFRPYTHNPDITTRYKHNLSEVVACRQEIEQLIEQKLTRQGIQINTARLSTQKLEARMAALKSERQARAKKAKGFEEIRNGLSQDAENMAQRHYNKGKSAGAPPAPTASAAVPRQSTRSPVPREKPPTFRAAGTAVRTAASLPQNVKSSTRSSATLSSTGSADLGSSYGDQSFSGTSVTERTLSESGEEDDDDDNEEYSDESDWDSGGEIPARATRAAPVRAQPRHIPTSPKVSVRIPTLDNALDVDSDPEELQPAAQRSSYKAPEPRGEKVRALTSSLERSLSFGNPGQKPAGGVALPGKQESFDDEDESDFSLSSLDDRGKPVPQQRSGQQSRPTTSTAPVPAARTRPVTSPRSTINQAPHSSAVTAFTIDDYSDFDDSDLDVHHLT